MEVAVVYVNNIMQLQDSIGPAMFDGPEGAVVLHIECTWPVITPAWRLMALFEPDSVAAGTSGYTFSVAATMRKEAF